MTTVKVSFVRPNPSGEGPDIPLKGTVIATLLQVDSPSDLVRRIGSGRKFTIDEDGSVELELEATEVNQAYRVSYFPSDTSNPPRYVRVPDTAEVEWENLVDVNPVTLTPVASGGSGEEVSPVLLALVDAGFGESGQVLATDSTGEGFEWVNP